MKRVLSTFVAVMAIGLALLASAHAQEEKGIAAPVTKITPDEVPVSAPDAVPDWYQRFSADDLTTEYPAWSGTSQQDVNLKLGSSSRWNLQLGLSSRDGNSGLRREEMWAGATYNITSRLSIGGSVGVETENFAIDGDRANQQFEPGIRLQSAFKF